MYTPENQYRCTIIRGKSQSDMEDLLPLYANIVHKYCPCEENAFKESSRKKISKALFNTEAYDKLSDSNKKTVDNHLTEIAGTLLGLYYPKTEGEIGTMIYESPSCKNLIENHDFPTFFKNLCLNFQFPNGAKSVNHVKDDIDHHLNIKPFCYVVSLLYYAQKQDEKVLLTKQEIGFYVLNNLDVLRGKVPCKVVYERIIQDRKNKVKRDKLRGSKDWQHINEQFNLLELANIIECDKNYLWLNPMESKAISIFIRRNGPAEFDCYNYDFDKVEERKALLNDWRAFYGTFNKELDDIYTQFTTDVVLVGKEELKAKGSAIKSTVELGDEGEALVFKLEQERVRNYKERLVNKVLLLGKTKGLGYDISSIEADENPQKPEFARYIEVKATKKITVPSFDKNWGDSLNVTAKEWVAAEQYGEYYNIYRVYFTKKKTIVVRIQNPYKKADEGNIEVYPTIYQMNFDSSVIEIRYDK